MSSQPTPATPHSIPGPEAADTHAHREALDALITMGTDFARLLHQQATTQAAVQPGAPAPHPTPAPAPATLITLASAFDAIARAVRRTILLARTLDQPVPPAKDPARRRAAARKQVIREVEDAIHRAANPDSDTAESLTAELRDRLDAPDLDDDLADRPTADIIAEICRDLGLAAPLGTSPWRRRTPADLQALNASAAAPTRPRHPGAAPSNPTPSPTHRPPDPQPDDIAIRRPPRHAQFQPGLTPPREPAATSPRSRTTPPASTTDGPHPATDRPAHPAHRQSPKRRAGVTAKPRCQSSAYPCRHLRRPPPLTADWMQANLPLATQGAAMDNAVRIEVPVQPETAAAIRHERQLQAIGHLIDRLVRPSADEDPLILLFKHISAEAEASGLTDQHVDAELAAYNSERRG